VVTNSFSGSGDGQVVQAGSVTGNIYLSQAPRPVPRECPPAPALFVDRTAELARLRELCATKTLLVLDGPPGTGKSALACKLAADARESFPDGQLYVDLRQHRRGGGVELSGVVEGFLRSLGIHGDWLSHEFGRRTALLRSVLHDKRVLILVDHATAAEQITAWLPNGPGCAVAVTSTFDLDELYRHGAVRVPVARLPVDDGVRLLAEYCGTERVEAEAEAARRLVELCGGLPLALNVVGARLRRRRSLRLAEAADQLASSGEEAVRAAFDSACDDLPERTRRLYALLGVHPGADIPVHAVQALMPAPDEHLETLQRANLVQWDEETGRVRLGELVARHAAEKARDQLTGEGRELALRRVVRHYLVFASAADLAAMGDRLRFAEPDDEILAAAGQFAGERAAMDALDTERHNLVAVVTAAAEQGWFAEVWRLAEALWPYFLSFKHHRDWIATSQFGVEAAQALNDPVAEARMRSQLARALTETRRFDRAEDELRQALALAESSGHQRLLASVEEFTGKLHVARGAYERAVPHLRRALEINLAAGRTRGAAVQHLALAQALHLSGDHVTALAEADQAMELLESLRRPESRNRGNVLLTRAKILVALHREDDAQAVLREAARLLRDAGAAQLEAKAWELLAELHVEQAREHLTEALAIYRRLGDVEAVARLEDQLRP